MLAARHVVRSADRRKVSGYPAAGLTGVQFADPGASARFVSAADVFCSGARWISSLSRRARSRPTILCRSYDDLFVRDTERSLSDLAADLAQRIRDHQPQGPYYLGGMCLAGRVAFAIALELRRQREEVALLAIIDKSTPGYNQLSRVPALRSFIARLNWHVHYALHGNRQQRIDWIAGGGFRALDCQARYRAWRLARWFFRRIGRPLPQSLRPADPAPGGGRRQRHDD